MNDETELVYASEGVVRTEKVIEKVVIVKELYATLPKQQIGVLGICPGAGATFVSLALAASVERMGIRAGIKEVYDDAIIDIAGESAVRFGTCQAPVMFYDFSGAPRGETFPEDVTDKIKEMQKLVIVVDPLPSKIVKGHGLFCRIKNEDIDRIVVINKMQREVRKNEIKQIFSCEEIFEIPFVSPQYIYTAEKKSLPVADICFVRKELEPKVKKILSAILQTEILNVTGSMIK